MTSTSKFGYYVSPYGTLAADYPMSTATARWYVNNARHLIDQASQFRINWSALADTNVSPASLSQGGIAWGGSGTTWVHVITQYFPVSMIGSDSSKTTYKNPVNLAVSVAGYTENSDELLFRVVIQPADASEDSDFIDNECLAYWDDSTTSNTSEWIVDGVTTSLYPDDLATRVTPKFFATTEHDSNVYDISMYMLRITIYAQEGYSSGDGHLTAICVRECQL